MGRKGRESPLVRFFSPAGPPQPGRERGGKALKVGLFPLAWTPASGENSPEKHAVGCDVYE